MAAIEDVEKFIELVKTYEGIVNFDEEPTEPALIDEAEHTLGLPFPPSYRRFLELLGECDIEERSSTASGADAMSRPN